MIDACLEHLAVLVSFDTRNPPRAITDAHEIVRYVSGVLTRAGYTVSIEDLGDGSVCIDALRGNPDMVVNCHLDTVPAASGWESDPFVLVVQSDRAFGLGACDVKGSAACLLAAAEHTDSPSRILFTTDEEAGRAQCVRTWAEQHISEVRCAVVCEPTGLRGVLAHRGLLSGSATFAGTSGHSSKSEHARSATHDLALWAAGVLGHGSFASDIRFNVGRIEGGTKPNMIADSASARFGFRFPHRSDPEALLQAITACAPDPESVHWETTFLAPALAPDAASESLCAELGIPVGAPVDFWTEAALFAQAGIPAMVFGPGDIAQAHAQNESIPIDQLAEGCRMFAEILRATTPNKERAHATP